MGGGWRSVRRRFCGRARRPYRLRYGLYRALLLVAVLVIPSCFEPVLREEAQHLIRERVAPASLAAPGIPNKLPAQQPLHQAAPPIASGANPPYPLNHTFDAEPVTLGAQPNADFETPGTTVGTPPTNYDLATASIDTGTPPTDWGFTAGTTAAWSPTGSPTIETSGGPDGNWAKLDLTNNESLTSAAFTVANDAQGLTFDLGYLTTSGTAAISVYVATGPSYTMPGTATKSFTCTACNSWVTGMVDLTAYRGQSIQVKFKWIGGVIGLDRIRPQIILPGYTPASTSYVRDLDGGDPYAWLANGDLVTDAFSVDPTAQTLTVRLRGLSAFSDQAYVYVLSGPTYATSTQFIPTFGDSWTTYAIDASPWLGQSIKLKIHLHLNIVGVDDIGVGHIDLPNWTVSGVPALVTGTPTGTALAVKSSTLTSDAYTLPADAQQLSVRFSVQAAGGQANVYLLHGPSYGTTTTLSITPLSGSIGTWQEFKAPINEFAGQSVKLRVVGGLGGQIWVDDVGVQTTLVPGWSVTTASKGVAAASDAYGSYLTSWVAGQAIEVVSSLISPGIVDVRIGPDSRSYLISYAIGNSVGSQIHVWWLPTGGGNPLLVYNDAADTPTGFKNGRFTMADIFGTSGRLQVKVTNGGKLYSIGDNVARQQAGDPFGQQVGGIDTSTGSFELADVDLAIEGGPIPVTFARYYHGHADRVGELGARWTHTFDTFATLYANLDIVIVFGSGQEEVFRYDIWQSVYEPLDSRVHSTVVRLGSNAIQYTSREGLVYNFTASGDLTSIVDTNGNAIVVYRDAQGRVASIADPGQRSLELAYDPVTGNLVSVTGPNGAVVSYTYDGNGDLIAVDKPNDARIEYSYSRHRLTEIRARRGDDLATATMETVLTLTLDSVNRVAAQTDGEGRTMSFAYQTPAAGITRVTSPFQTTTDFYFDHFARTVYVDTPTLEDWSFVYDDKGNLTKYIDGSGSDVDFDFNDAAEPTQMLDPLGNPSSITWDSAEHLPREVIDARGVITKNEYDAHANLIKVIVDIGDATHLNLTTIWAYDGDGHLIRQVVDPDYPATSYDGLHLVTDFTYADDGTMASKIVDPDGLNLVTSYTYTNSGLLETETDPRGNTTTFTYDIGDRMIAQTDPTDATWTYSFDILGELTMSTDPEGAMTSWIYLGMIGQPDSKFDADNNVWNYERDARTRITRELGPLGHDNLYDYDANGRVSRQVVDPEDPATPGAELHLVTTYAYDNAGRLITEVVDPTDPARSGDELNLTTTYQYRDDGRLEAKQLPNGAVWTYDYDEVGNPTAVTDPLNHTTTSEYDHANRLIRVIDPLGHAVETDYDAAGRQIAERRWLDASTVLTTTTEYDAAGRVIRETDPLGHDVTYTYDANGNQTSVTTEAGLTTFYAYDAANRVIEITEPGTPARVTQYEYDGNGHRTREIAADGTVTTFAYNTRGLLTQEVVDPDDPTTSYDGLNLVIQYGYDALGRRTSVTNPRGFATTYGYDAADRLIRLGDGAGPTAALVTYGYDRAGRLISVTNPRGKTTTFVRDALGNPLIERDPLGREKTATFDLLGRLATATDPNGYAVHYDYDDAGRQIAVRDAATSALLVGYGYDNLNRQTSMTDGRGTTTWSYDLSDQVEQVAGPEGTLSYDHDAAGRRTAMTLSGNRTVAYAYDPSGRLETITDWDDRATTLTYEPSGALDTIARPNGVTTAFDYDAAGRLRAISHFDASETALAEYAYTLDGNGNRTAVTITGTAVTTGVESYTYDDHDRLLSASYPGGGTALYQYDLNGNRTQVTSGTDVTNYYYDDADQLLELRDHATSDLITAFTYDANGNRTAATSGAVTNTYTYDWRNRLSSATVDGTTVSYEYAGDDLRTERTVAGGATETLLWDRQAGLPELVDDGTNVFLQFGDGELAEIGASGDAVYPLADALGSSRATTDETGAVTGTADYDVWGNARATTGAQAGMGWTGELRDDATGLTYLRSRDYSPGGGRFLQRDTVSPNGPGSQGYNPYAYAAGNPATHTDPSGHSTTSPSALTAGLILGVLDLSVVIAAIVTIFKPARDLMRMMNTLPPVIRGLIVAILNFVLPLLINILVMIIIAAVIEVAAQFIGKTLAGAAVLLKNLVKFFSQTTKLFRICGKPGMLGGPCKLFAKIFPKLPKRWFVRCLTELGEEVGELGAEVALGGGITTTDGAMAVISACAGSEITETVMDTGFWRRSEVGDRRVYQRDDLIDPDRVDTFTGKTNRELMCGGYAPYGPDGKKINLHHMTQRDDSPLAEVTTTFHTSNRKVIHINPNTIPSGIDRPRFELWKKGVYWPTRCMDF